ncbi:MAG: pyridoxamine 5'-phosphate oxidase family protein [Planctomycetota bacterium]
MSNPRPRPTSLDDVLETIWTELEIGANKAKHGFHQPVLATTDADGTPRARTVVLRRTDRAAGAVLCHTDARSAKLDHVRANPAASWCFYDKSKRIQVRATGELSAHADDGIADDHWQRSPARSRRCYLAPAVPGSPAGGPSPNLPADMTDREPTHEESEAGRPNFAVLRCTLRSLDYLELYHDGHVRALFTRDDGGWTGTWTHP